MPDNETPLGWLTYPDAGDRNWYDEDSNGQGLQQWLAQVELLGVPTYPTFADLPGAGVPATDGDQRQFAAVASDRTVYRTDGSSWVPWFGAGTSNRPMPGTSHYESLETEVLNNTEEYISGDATVNNINDAIEDVHSRGGGTIHLEPGATYVVDDQTGIIKIKSNVNIDGHWATVRLADGLDDDAPINALFVFDPHEDGGCTDAHLTRVETNGNLDNNSFSERRGRGGVAILPFLFGSESNTIDDGTKPERCSIRQIYSHDTIASTVYFGGSKCAAENIWCENSGNDHLFYMTTPDRSVARNVWMTGMTRSAAVAIHTAAEPFGRDCYGNVCESFYVFDISHEGIFGDPTQFAVNQRPRGDYEVHNNTIRDLHIHSTSDDNPPTVRIRQPYTTLENVYWTGKANDYGKGLIRFEGNSPAELDGPYYSTARNINISVDEKTASGMLLGIYLTNGASNILLDDVTIVDNSSGSNVRGIWTRSDDGFEVRDITMRDLDLDVSATDLRIGPVSEPLENINLPSPLPPGFDYNIDSGVEFGDGTMIPQDVRNVSNPFEGMRCCHDGGGSTPKGPAFYDGSSWTSLVDGTTIT